MAISAKDVNALRQATGAGMMDCKKALEEANGDFDGAVEILRKKGQKVSAKRADREASEGGVFVDTNADSSMGFILSLNCETDFVAKNDAFVNLGNSLIKVASDNSLGTVEDLLAANLDGKAVQDHLTDMMGKIGEKIEIAAYKVVKGEAVVPYIHSNSKLGVLVSLKGTGGKDVVAVGKDVAMQIAAMNPVGVSDSDVSEEVKEKELAFGREKAIQEGKPENIVDKIAQGMLKKFMKDNTLLAQDFVKDGSKSVAQVLKDVNADLTVESFSRVSIG